VDRRSITSAVTLLVLCAILVGGAAWGWNNLFPPPDETTATPTGEPTCTPSTVAAQQIRSREVTVSVFNAGDRAGQAGRALDAFEARGFRAGAVGNAPEGTQVRRAEVWAAREDDPAARLVARQLGRDVGIVVQEPLGPGVTVVVGNRFERLARAPRSLEVSPEEEVCQ